MPWRQWLADNWKRILIELPANIVDVWLRVYMVVIAIAGFVSIGVLIALLVSVILWVGFGIRWGW